MGRIADLLHEALQHGDAMGRIRIRASTRRNAFSPTWPCRLIGMRWSTPMLLARDG
jgi:hypothetical protein